MGSWRQIAENTALTAHVVLRDLRVLAREPWTYALAALLLAAIGGSTLAGIPGRAPASTAVALYTQRVASIHVITLFAVALFALPYLAAHAIRQDRPESDGALLSLTCLKPVHLVLGKVLAVWGIFLLTTIASLPLSGLVLFFSGVDLRGFAPTGLHLGAFALCCAGVGAAVGINELNPIKSWFNAVFHLALLCIYPVIFGHIAMWFLGGATLPDLLYSLAPFSISGFGTLGGPKSPPYPYAGILYLLVCAAGALAIATFRWRETISGRQRVATLSRGIAGHQAARFAPPIPDGANPIFERERRRPGVYTDPYIPYLFLFGAFWGLFALLADAFLPSPGAAGTKIDLTRAVAVLAFAPPLAARAIAREQEQNTLDQLRLTALTARGIISGKTRGLIQGTVPFLAGLYLMACVNCFLFDRETFALVTVHCLLWLPIYFVFISRCAMLGPLIAPGPISNVLAGYGFAALGALGHVIVDSQIMLRNLGLLLVRADATGLAVFWCIDAALLFLVSIPLLDILARALQFRRR